MMSDSQFPALRYDPAHLVHVDGADITEPLNILNVVADQL